MNAWLKKLFSSRSIAIPVPALETQSRANIQPPPSTSAEQRRRGNRFLDQGNLPAAVICYQQAVALDPESVDAHTSLGYALQQTGAFAAAQTTLERAFKLQPSNFDAAYLLGQVSASLHQPDKAAGYFETALGLRPNFEPLYGELCQAQFQAGAMEQAHRTIARGIQSFPQNAAYRFFQGNLYAHAKNWTDAIPCYETAVGLDPALVEASDSLAAAHQKLGYVFLQSGNYVLSERHSRQALAIRANDAYALNNLGTALAAQDCLHDAEAAYQAAIAIAPRAPVFHGNLAGNLLLQGRLEEAIAGLLQAVEQDASIAPHSFSNLLFALNYQPDAAAEDIFKSYNEFERRFGAPHQADWMPHTNPRDPQRRLKVGYVSPDFKNHAANFFMEPLLARHDRSVVVLYAYAELAKPDAVSQRYQASVDHWVPTLGLSDAELAQRIRADGIDILVDLAGHTVGNRLGVFARKPAPVSLSWMGYGYTTGLRAVDYYLTDAASAPEGSEHLFSEEPWRLPGCYTAYRPGPGMGEVNALPALERGYVTLGTLTRGVRINHRTIRVWAAILQRLPTAHIVIDSRSFKDASVQQAAVAKFVAHGIAPERLHIGFNSPPWDVLRGIDIGLDCFPHNSGTTLFETLYMGLPYVTLADRPSVGRIGSAILQGLGHPEWIAESEEDYIDKVVALASDLPALAELRAGLRQQMQSSALMDEVGFARQVEAAYTAMFERWAEKPVNAT